MATPKGKKVPEKKKPAAKTAAKKAVKTSAKPAAKKPAAKAPAKSPAAKAAAKVSVKPAAKPAPKEKIKITTKPVVPVKAKPPIKPVVQKPVAVKPVAVPVAAVPAKPAVIVPEKCPCGSQKLYVECCGPIHKSASSAQTAEALMRARYSAYVKADVGFVMESSHPDLRKTLDEKATETWAKGSKWHGLKIVETQNGGPADSEGIVEFICEYSDAQQTHTLHERARFSKQNNQWYYVDGDVVTPKPYVRETPKVGRNDPCPCGSGMKYKKCHGRAGDQKPE